MFLIKVCNLTKEFKTNKKYPGFKGAIKSLFSTEYTVTSAVDNMNFEIEEGEVVGYIGSNGAGKSTTIKMMTGILTPTSGKVEVNGIIPYENRTENAMNIGVVFGQRTQLWWDLPLSETFSLLRDIYSVSPEDFKERMKFFNEVLEIDEFMLRPVRTLSLGQRMRADLAASLIHNPKILYLDEPTIGLDVVVKEKVRNAIKQINKKYNTTVILTTHDLEDIEELCDRIIIIDKGVKIYDGSLSEIKDKYGYMTNVSILIKKNELEDKININSYFNLDNNDLNLSDEDGKINITFNKNKISQMEIIQYFMENYILQDFSVKETSIDDIIKKIYRKEV
ncbi:ATP-binding cassette domain-containing protein [Clostridium butyricum]|uniref:ABC transporter ATP-binding protein n=1 Tax=Clostridium butyricum TaxID=1492 RepID=UPI002ABD6503|nr:ATP-binding cassette domain-containing protein [Clostridium butyricum]